MVRELLLALRLTATAIAIWGMLYWALVEKGLPPALGLGGVVFFGSGFWFALPEARRLVRELVSGSIPETHARIPDERHRGIAAGVIAGSVRGALAATFTFGVVVVADRLTFTTLFALFLMPPVLAIWFEWRHPALVSVEILRAASRVWLLIWGPVFLFFCFYMGPRVEQLLDFDRDRWPMFLSISAILGAAVSGCEAASSRTAGPIARFGLRALAGLAGPSAAFGYLVSGAAFHSKADPLFATTRAFKDHPEAAAILPVVGLAVAFAEMVAGTPFPGASRESRVRRGARFAAAAGFVFAAFLVPELYTSHWSWVSGWEETTRFPPLAFPLVWLACSVLMTGIVAAYSVGLVLARPIALRIARRIEPGNSWLDRRDRARAHDREADLADAARGKGKIDEALAFATKALEHAIEDPWLSGERRDDARRVFEIIVEEERFDAIDRLPRGVPELPILLAEVQRIRHEPDAAIDSIRSLMKRRELGLPLQASAHAILALAHADRGERVLAESELAGLRVASLVYGPLLARHGLARVAAYVDFMTRAAGRS